MVQTRATRRSAARRLGASGALVSCMLLAGCLPVENVAGDANGARPFEPYDVPSDYVSTMAFPIPRVLLHNDRQLPPPLRTLRRPQGLASFGDWLYVAFGDRVLTFDTRNLGAAPRTIPLDVVVHELFVQEDRLKVLVSAAPEAAALERNLEEYELSLGADPGQPTLLSKTPLSQGGLVQTWRLGDGSSLSVSATYPRFCADGFPYTGGEPEHMLVASPGNSLSVEADSFFETESGFVLAKGYDGRPATLHVFDVLPGGVVRRGPLSLEEGIIDSPIGVFESGLAVFQAGSAGLRLSIYDSDAPSTPAASLDLRTPPDGTYFDIQAARFSGRFVMLPKATISENAPGPGVVIDWAREGGPVVTAELPADLPHMQRLGERWLAWGPTRSVLFTLGAEGTLDVEPVLGAPAADTWSSEVYWDAAAQQAILPYTVAGTGLLGAAPEQALAVLDLAREPLEWRAGPPITGLLRFPPQAARAGNGLYSMTYPRPDSGGSWQIERIDGTLPERSRIEPASRVLARSSNPLGSAEIRIDNRDAYTVHLESPGGVTDVELSFPAQHLVPVGDVFLAYSSSPPRDCSYGECGRGEAPGISVFALEPPRLVGTVRGSAPSAEDGARTWPELIVQGEQVVVRELRHREGETDEEWFYALDTARAQLAEPVRLQHAAGSWLGFSARVGEGGAALVEGSDVTDTGSGARMQVRRLASLDAAGLAAAEGITVRGSPWYITGNDVLAIDSELLPGGAAARLLVHHQQLEGGSARVVNTLALGTGTDYGGSVWATERGYVQVSRDGCDTSTTTLSALHFSQGSLEHEADLELPGVYWRYVRATDDVVVLVRGDQYAIIDVQDGSLALRAYETHGTGSVVDVLGRDVLFIDN